jgi:hypothetical protein
LKTAQSGRRALTRLTNISSNSTLNPHVKESPRKTMAGLPASERPCSTSRNPSLLWTSSTLRFSVTSSSCPPGTPFHPSTGSYWVRLPCSVTFVSRASMNGYGSRIL